jgi:hypothetical protein
MTENQQKIIDSLVAEFNSRNEQQSKRPFKLIDVDEFDAINQRHIELKADAQRTKDFWDDECDRYIDELIQQIKEDIGDRLCVKRGNEAMNNSNYSEDIFIYKYNTDEHYIWEKALRMRFHLIKESRYDDVTRKYYDYYTGLGIKRYVTGSMEMAYNDEVEFFNCQYTKDKLKDLLS